jgi:hypothetical protein
MGLCGVASSDGVAAHGVLTVCHWLKMIWIHASTVAACVI